MFDADIFDGMLKSRILWRLVLMHDHISFTLGECLCIKWPKKNFEKLSQSVFIWVMSALFQSLIFLLGDFFLLIKSLLSVRTASWSLTPGTTEDFWIRSKLLVKKRSRILSPLVGLSTVLE